MIFSLIFSSFSGVFSIPLAHSDTEKCFIISAYYSPLPEQDYYYKGNYQAEIRLNWHGVRWASGKEVFSGMLAAPKDYEFGTAIELPWLGIGIVEDRWWAIVPAGQRWYKYDRLDMWVWYGEEGLARALTWGKKTLCGKIISDYSGGSTIDVYSLPISNSTKIWTKKQNTVFSKGIGTKSSSEDIKQLQNFLKEIWLYNWEINGIYNQELIDSIVKFQKENKIIEWEHDSAAWYWGIKTRNIAMKKYQNWDFDKVEKLKELVIVEEKSLEPSIFDSYVWVDTDIEKVKQLQIVLEEIWLYDWEISGKYEDIKDDIISYQLEKKLIYDKTNWWAGHFGPKTSESLKRDYISYIEKKEEKEKKKLEEALAKKEIEKKLEDTVDKHISYIWTPKEWDISPEVRDLQKTLSLLGYFEVKDTAIFGQLTKESIINYQLDKGIIKSRNDRWAWYIWPQTKESMKKDLIEKIKQKAQEEKLITSIDSWEI